MNIWNGCEHMEAIKAAVLMALQKELPYFLMPGGKMPESVELRVFYDHSMATIRVGGEEILRMLEISRMPETAGRAGDEGAGKGAEEQPDKETAGRAGDGEAGKAAEERSDKETAGRAGDGEAGKAAEERSDKEKADSPFGMPAKGKDKAPVQP